MSRLAASARAAAVARLDPIELSDVLAVAGLQTRTDRKYLVTPSQYERMLDQLGGRFQALEIDGIRGFRYESVYFDTALLDLFHAHRQRRRRRYKVRTRTYLDSDESMFEVKLEGRRGSTIKRRMPYAPQDRNRMTDRAREFVTDVLTQEYAMRPAPLRPTLSTAYTRSTLVDPVAGSRLTCDVDLVCTGAVGTRRHGPDLILLESKSVSGRSPAEDALAALGVRPVQLSKYCVSVALLHPHVAANRWSRLLRRHFDWTRAPLAG